ncbi:MAG: hypothetical protein R2709_00165 [Marmoricola sp.]
MRALVLSSMGEAIMAYDMGEISLHARINIRLSGVKPPKSVTA